MIDEEVVSDGDNGEMSGEPDVAKLRLVEARVVAAATHPLVARAETATDRVLYRVRARRDEHDQREGYFRDYKDGTGRPSDALSIINTMNVHDDALKSVRVTWRHKLDVVLAVAMAETNDKRLAEKLTEVAAVVTAWQEAIELRGSKARILAEQGAVKHVQRRDGTWKKVHLMPWWRRVLKALRLLK